MNIATWPVCTRYKQDFIPFSIDSRCLLQIGDESPDICIYSLTPLPPHIYVSKCMYVYVHISLFLPECACTTIIDISPRIFSLMYCCCVSIIIVICICPPGALIWLINLFLFLFLQFTRHIVYVSIMASCSKKQNKFLNNVQCCRVCDRQTISILKVYSMML